MIEDHKPAAYCLFCEDIRQEVGGRSSLMGVFRSGVRLPRYPSVLPKLAFYLIVDELPQKNLPKTVVFQVFSDWNGDEPIVEAPLSSEEYEKLKIQHKNTKKKKKGIIITAVAMPFEVPRPGLLSAMIRIGNTKYVCGELRFEE